MDWASRWGKVGKANLDVIGSLGMKIYDFMVSFECCCMVLSLIACAKPTNTPEYGQYRKASTIHLELRSDPIKLSSPVYCATITLTSLPQ